MTESIVRYGTARFYVPEGMYSIEELERMVDAFKEAKQIQDKHLEQSLKPSN